MATMAVAAMGGCRLFVGDLPGDITKDDLKYVFQHYGEVCDVYVLPAPGRSGDMSAFVQFVEANNAAAAIAAMNGVYSFRPGAKPVVVRHASERPDKGKGGGKGMQMMQGQGPCAAPPAVMLTGSDAKLAQHMTAFLEMFLPGGKFEALGLYQGQGHQDTSSHDFQGPASVPAAPVNAGCGFSGGPNMSCGGAAPASQLQADPLPGVAGMTTDVECHGGMPPPETVPPPPSGDPSRLWVGNLPADVTRDDVLYVFGAYGTVTDAHVVSAQERRGGRSFAIVKYTDAIMGHQAVSALNGVYEIRPGEGPIIVKVAQPEKSEEWRQSNQTGGARYTPY
eukprot:TRINITY_DN73855_c0_g1_i1.p1 TRINITY_DN73855_c0_g1~~TRINITY_DN73855_c0_g1_i1.p1  ORF type:complete len:336 (-),score=43.98 TRINITY_DN73855_c0_g1_i1:92-1099(-)